MRWAIMIAFGMLAACKSEPTVSMHGELADEAAWSEPARPMRPAIVSVAVTSLRPGGKPWDPGDPKGAGKPDIAVCIHTGGHHRCYPGGNHISGPACQDSFECDVRVEVPVADEFDVEVWDADVAIHDLISKGQCKLGERCHFSAATVVVTDTAR